MILSRDFALYLLFPKFISLLVNLFRCNVNRCQFPLVFENMSFIANILASQLKLKDKLKKQMISMNGR